MESKVFETWDTPVPGVTDVAAPVGIPGVKEAEERIKGVSTGVSGSGWSFLSANETFFSVARLLLWL